MISSEGILRSSRTPPTPPVSVPLSAPNRRFSKVGRKQSNGSVQSSSSSGTARSTESMGTRQPARSRIRRHQHRLSAVFRRSVLGDRGEETTVGDETAVTDDPSELSNHITAPGILKIFGTEICEGANYKSVLATTHSSARELVKEALERYSLSKAEADAYVLCDVIGRITEQEWRAECLRVVGDNERPLLLQSLWKPREGYARRFEIQRRACVEERSSRDTDTVTAGINAQARRLQKTRSRGRSVVLDAGGADAVAGDGPALRRSLSETDLEPESLNHLGPAPEVQQNLRSQSLSLGGGAHETASEREETESSDDNFTEYSIHPPLNFPYFLVLQSFSYTQDFIIYPLSGSCTNFGRVGEQPSVGVTLWAPDIQSQHCSVRRMEAAPTCELSRGPGPLVLRPLNGALVKRNGVVITQEVELSPGDIISLGAHYVFMFKDPTAETGYVSHMTLPWSGESSRVPSPRPPPFCETCVLSTRGDPGDPEAQEKVLPCLRDADGLQLVLTYDVGNEARVLKEVFALVDWHDGRHKLTASFLLCLCLQQSATQFPMADLRRLLLQITSEVQTAVWEKARELVALQPETGTGAEPVTLQPVSTEKLLGGLKPLVLWMANSIELLHFIHQEVPRLLHGISQEEEEEEEDCLAVLELRLSTIRPASEEAMTVLEEVVMFTFQQCVYYLTKLLYQALPSLLDCNPFSENGQVQIPGDVGGVLDIFTKTMNLLKDFHVHPEISSQLFTYLFFFVNAFLFNLLMERGTGGSFYKWSCGVQIRANLDLLMDWAHVAGLGELAQDNLVKLSSAVNLLATPREHLLQSSWSLLRLEFASLSPAQLHHMLREYSPRRGCPSTWCPSNDEAEVALQTADILESFDNHPALILPMDGFLLDLKKPFLELSLIKHLSQLQMAISDPETNTRTTQSSQHGSAVPLKARRTKMVVPPKAHLERKHTEMALSRDGILACSAGSGDPDSSDVLLTQKLKALELPIEESKCHGNSETSSPSVSRLLTPPDIPQSLDRTGSELECQDPHPQHQIGPRWDTDAQEEGGSENHEIGDDEVFVVELQKAPGQLGLALVNGLETPLKMSGIYIKSVIPGTPAARSQKVRPGDRILAVNGLRLIGVDYHIGRELIQNSGERPYLLVSRDKRIYGETGSQNAEH